MRGHADKPPPSPSEFNPNVSPAVEAVLLRALAKKREERYQSAGEMAVALQQAVSGAVVEEVKAPPPVVAPAAPPTPNVPTYTPTATPRPTDTPTATPKPTNTPTPSAPPADMVHVPAGEFTMGSTDAEVDSALALCNEYYGDCERSWFEDEQLVHTVYLDAFYIDKTEVTNAQYQRCVEAGDCQAPTTCDWGEPTYGDASKADHPVVCVNWNDAQAYCAWAGARLPTEAEWERAARGGDGRVYPWGNTFDGSKVNFCDKNCSADWKDASVDDGYAGTAPVGSYPDGVGPYGALDMAGNVWEWVADWYDSCYYASSPESNPEGLASGDYPVFRGGSWNDYVARVRAALRRRPAPDVTPRLVGFRCAR
jgi:formylglycine-generating enzyme required for sulfatase activity